MAVNIRFEATARGELVLGGVTKNFTMPPGTPIQIGLGLINNDPVAHSLGYIQALPEPPNRPDIYFPEFAVVSSQLAGQPPTVFNPGQALAMLVQYPGPIAGQTKTIDLIASVYDLPGPTPVFQQHIILNFTGMGGGGGGGGGIPWVPLLVGGGALLLLLVAGAREEGQ